MKLGKREVIAFDPISKEYVSFYDLDTLINTLQSMRLKLIKSRIGETSAKKFAVRIIEDDFCEDSTQIELIEIFDYTEQEHFENEKKKAIQEFKKYL